ncbi:hypothetical protein GGR44_002122 [Sphingobium fontiphilum]|uniref:Uncharacterized protein n=1 Tax=Sphingobium fontiphilum TaxID=944425 RepID=A0A7W6GQV7_9SPHN|nr:hypothetical protein [Sphingobium fontiphilum]MBB3982459.1 hypothetical protein [Sphingobium fontiphilum]
MFTAPIRSIAASALMALGAMAQPAAAQFFWSPPDFSAAPFTDEAAAVSLELPGATPAELRAGMVWNLRAALNVAALQCQFEPTLLAVSNYNAAIAHHDAELDAAVSGLLAYFQRVKGKGKAGQSAASDYDTHIWSTYSTVHAQRGFCQAAGEVGRQAIFADRGKLYEVAQTGLPSIKKALILAGEQVYGDPGRLYTPTLPPLEAKCWKKGKMKPECQRSWNARFAARP